MITIKKQDSTYSSTSTRFSLLGLSTDTKPVDTYGGVSLANGSEFLEMDTGKAYYYDEAGATWVLGSGSGGGQPISSFVLHWDSAFIDNPVITNTDDIAVLNKIRADYFDKGILPAVCSVTKDEDGVLTTVNYGITYGGGTLENEDFLINLSPRFEDTPVIASIFINSSDGAWEISEIYEP